MESILRIEQIEKYYGNKLNLTKAIDNISFDVNEGEFVAIMGASGSGKTAVTEAIDECVEENILVDFFEKHREEVVEVSIYDYDEEEVRMVVARDMAEEMAVDMAEEMAEGMAEKMAEEMAEEMTEL